MQELQGNLWEVHEAGSWIAVTTNGDVNKLGKAVMGRGIALQAALRFPDLPVLLGEHLRDPIDGSNVVCMFYTHRIVTFPVKHHWREKADINLIQKSANSIVQLWTPTQAQIDAGTLDTRHLPLYMPRPGCGNGHLLWSDVKLVLEKILDDRFIVMDLHA